MFNVWPPVWEMLFTWLSLMMYLMVSYFVLSFFTRDVVDEIWTESSQFQRIFLPTFLKTRDSKPDYFINVDSTIDLENETKMKSL